MYEPANAAPEWADRTMGDLLENRARVAAELEGVEAEWLELGEKLEDAEAA